MHFFGLCQLEAWHLIDVPLCAVVVGKVLPPLLLRILVLVLAGYAARGGACCGLCGAAIALVLRLCCVSLACMLGGFVHTCACFLLLFSLCVSRSVGLVPCVFFPFFSLALSLLLLSSLSSSVFFSFSLCLSFLPQRHTVNEESIHQIGLNFWLPLVTTLVCLKIGSDHLCPVFVFSGILSCRGNYVLLMW